MDDAAAIRLRRSTPSHDAYTVYVYDRRVAALATARPFDARRWVTTTRWLHGSLHLGGRLVVGLGVQWTPTRAPLHGVPPCPAVLQLCVGHRCLVFHLAHADAVPEMLRRFLADPRVTFVGSGSANDRRMLWAHYGLRVARGLELRAFAGMGNASLEDMADRFLGYPGIYKPREVAMSAWHAPRLSPDQVQYACLDAYLAFRLGLVLCPAAQPPRQPVLLRPPAPPVQQRAPALVRQQGPPPAHQRAPAAVRQGPPPAQQRAPAPVRQAPPPVQQRAPLVFEVSPRAFSGGSVPAVVGVDTAITGSKVAARAASDVDGETDYDDYVDGTGTHGRLPIRVYASDSNDDNVDDSSDGFEHVRFGVFTDDEEDEDDGCLSYSGTGSLGAQDVNSNVDDDLAVEEGCNAEDDLEDEEGCNGDDLLDEEACDMMGGYHQEYTGTGILTDDNQMYGFGESIQCVPYANADDGMQEDCTEYLGHSEPVLDNGEGALAQDDRYDQEVDYSCDQDGEVEFDEFYLL
ncbi:hypothetical protein HU200_034823 [Digitaria exilis]|uniref:3'-5' exonuclease domain-containing protein n=1 Tax=Digitaria exilis TaxID=1010633 RepID=A0A835BH86_9POAL|nr:hypothetical protein HU200_034823 [Digitaria exilis]CAB3451685.1 unnamed protein product [Digitaria exilis]